MTHSHPSLIETMLQADFYPHPVHAVHLRQTHASWVMLTGDYVYKVKKPVDFGFLDFSTLEKRRHFCEEELRLNRRLAPELYLDVLPIAWRDGAFRLGEDGDVREWCLKMRQFEESGLLAERVEAGDFDPDWMDTLARDIADFHARAERNASINAYGAPHYLLRHIDASLNTALHHPHAIDAEKIHALRRQCMLQTQRLARSFEQRMADDRIRDCHGDLHLGNIALYKGRPTVFDCIEFNPEYRAIDTLNDIAFLVMDCEARGHPGLAFRLLSRYLEFSGDYAGMPLLPLFLSYRAGVRGKVACLLAEDAAIDAAEKRRKLQEAADYFDLAENYLRPPPSPCLFAVGGLSGSGKSRLALLGCGVERAVIIRTDATRKRIAAQYPDLPLYGEAMNRHTYQAMFDAATTLLTAGRPVILDATFLSADERRRAAETAAACGVTFRFAWLDVPADRLRHNIRQRQAGGRDVSDADLAVLEGQLADYRRPDDPGIRFLDSAESWPWVRGDQAVAGEEA